MKKLRLGWFTFTCCEDSTIIFTELLNSQWQEWRDKLEFIHAKVLQTKNSWEKMDVAFVEGAISSNEQEEKLKKVRSLTKKLVAIGACACIGMPSSQRNALDETTKAEIAPYLLQFHMNDRVKAVEEVVKVDDKVHGCPMNEMAFLSVLGKYLKEFRV